MDTPVGKYTVRPIGSGFPVDRVSDVNEVFAFPGQESRDLRAKNVSRVG